MVQNESETPANESLRLEDISTQVEPIDYEEELDGGWMCENGIAYISCINVNS